MNLIQQLEQEEIARLTQGKSIPEFAPGDTVIVQVKVKEGTRERLQAYECVEQRLLPLDDDWRRVRAALAWPTKHLPEVAGGGVATLAALVGEHVFVSLFRACAESLASENASRLAAMDRADRNIDELVDGLRGRFHRLRQDGIDEELFDVVAGFEALVGDRSRAGPAP